MHYESERRSRRVRSQALAGAAIVLVGLLALAGCGGSGKQAATGTSTGSRPAAFDRSFIDAMVPHHLSAIDMANAAREAGLEAPVLQRIARNIVSSQQREIDQMKQWRKQWYGSAVVDPNGAEGLGMSMGDMGMSGSPADIRNAANVDSAFASMMTAHHRAAIAMARMALTRAQHPKLGTLARQIIAAQQREIRQLKPYARGGSMGGMPGM